jgi:oxygen-dependent protoporphyrinogen oxidase
MSAALPTRPRIVIIGGGVAGLACACRLAAMARERGSAIDLSLLESSGRTGGVISTERHDGFLVEGGPDCFISEKPWAVDLCRRLGLEDEIIGTNPALRRSFVLARGRLLPIPEGFQLLAPSRILPFATSPILSLAGRLRAACDLVLPRGAAVEDESLASFVRRRFGDEVLERLAQPLVAGIYNADPERLSLRATMPRFLEMERRDRSVILALLKGRRRSAGAGTGVSGARYSLFVTLRGGLQTLVDRLAAALPAGAVRLRTRAVSVERAAPKDRPGPPDREGDGPPARWRVRTETGESVAADAVVVALPGGAAAPLLRGLDPPLADLLADVPYGPAAVVSLGYRREDVPHPLDGFGFVAPRSEGRSVLACTFSSVKFAGRASKGAVLLRCFMRAAEEGTVDLEKLERSARDDLRDTLGIAAAPIFFRVSVHPRSMPRYQVGHLATVGQIEDRLGRLPGLALAGNGLHGVGIPDCVRSGERAAELISPRGGSRVS